MGGKVQDFLGICEWLAHTLRPHRFRACQQKRCKPQLALALG